jgi:hypothetical protein
MDSVRCAAPLRATPRGYRPANASPGTLETGLCAGNCSSLEDSRASPLFFRTTQRVEREKPRGVLYFLKEIILIFMNYGFIILGSN